MHHRFSEGRGPRSSFDLADAILTTVKSVNPVSASSLSLPKAGDREKIAQIEVGQ